MPTAGTRAGSSARIKAAPLARIKAGPLARGGIAAGRPPGPARC
ncbi:MAG TPA: hypothetical protein VMH35_13225 [Streptosporangiaceae bacterium]|nr:hypothetical protein [Streptosporangiaceae bacterium]